MQGCSFQSSGVLGCNAFFWDGKPTRSKWDGSIGCHVFENICNVARAYGHGRAHHVAKWSRTVLRVDVDASSDVCFIKQPFKKLDRKNNGSQLMAHRAKTSSFISLCFEGEGATTPRPQPCFQVKISWAEYRGSLGYATAPLSAKEFWNVTLHWFTWSLSVAREKNRWPSDQIAIWFWAHIMHACIDIYIYGLN